MEKIPAEFEWLTKTTNVQVNNPTKDAGVVVSEEPYLSGKVWAVDVFYFEDKIFCKVPCEVLKPFEKK